MAGGYDVFVGNFRGTSSLNAGGYDVFMGNFRGTSSLRHKKETISAREYWDFTLEENSEN
ncbi:hypothetical protein T484DRAFT_1833567 [Baffinella frigidus]|nr:hypothetical protein T484DRAFT_1833567 [Cryptophyta sp. CCMP2293]